MSDKSSPKYPYRALGSRIKTLREKLRESLAEVSGAVEIDMEALRQIEQGSSRPSEDILMLLISHLKVKDEEAVRLWEMAGYTQSSSGKGSSMQQDDMRGQQMLMIMPMDARVVYTDTVQISVNKYGVVMNFMQNNGSNNQPMAISRVGMSREHAQSMLELLKESLYQADQAQRPKRLPSQAQDKTKKNPEK